MTFYDYKVTPAPKRLKRIKGVRSTAELFSATLAEAINAAAREGWEYLRAESLPAEEAGRWFRRGSEVIETVLIFRRPRETLGPRLAAAKSGTAQDHDPEAVRLGVDERPVPDRAPERAQPSILRREPRLGDAQDDPAPLRPAPRLGPADRT
ncbi:MAG: hypothetical protein H0T41_07670 [Rhodobacteraceae bacterium]|nr:hypothetical protein [Paracoccaceae bacterium]